MDDFLGLFWLLNAINREAKDANEAGSWPQHSQGWPVYRRGGAWSCGCGWLCWLFLSGGVPGFDPCSAGRDGGGGFHLEAT